MRSLQAECFKHCSYALALGLVSYAVKKGREVFAGYLGDSGARVTGAGVSPAVQHALTLLAETLESLHARVSRLEAIVARTQGISTPSAPFNTANTFPGLLWLESLQDTSPAHRKKSLKHIPSVLSLW